MKSYADIGYLTKLWADYRKPRAHQPGANPAVSGFVAGAARVARYGQRMHRKIIVDSTENYGKMVEFAEDYVTQALP